MTEITENSLRKLLEDNQDPELLGVVKQAVVYLDELNKQVASIYPVLSAIEYNLRNT